MPTQTEIDCLRATVQRIYEQLPDHLRAIKSEFIGDKIKFLCRDFAQAQEMMDATYTDILRAARSINAREVRLAVYQYGSESLRFPLIV